MVVESLPAAAASGAVDKVGVGLATSVRVRDLASEGTEDIAVEVEVEAEADKLAAVGAAEVSVLGLEPVVRLVRRRRQEHWCRPGP